MIRERCSCGAEIETDEEHALKIVKAWRTDHPCNKPVDHVGSVGFGVIEQAPDHTEKELHIGFRYQEDDE